MSAKDKRVTAAYRQLPSVDKMLAQPNAATLIDTHGRQLTTNAIRVSIEHARTTIKNGDSAPDSAALIAHASDLLSSWTQPRPQSVINATGVIVHTNLGRAPLSKQALEAVQSVAAQWIEIYQKITVP